MNQTFELSDYQKKILDYVDNSTGNLLVDAKAGSGKTSTLLLISDSILKQGKKCLFLAFNKSIVEELSAKINNPDCMVKTIHSLGLSFIRSYLYRLHKTEYDLQIDTGRLREMVKYYYGKICSDLVERRNMDLSKDDLKDLHNNLISDLVSLVNFSRFYNVNYKKEGATDWLINKCCWYLPRNREDVPNYQKVIQNCIDEIKHKFEHPDIVNGIPTYIIDYTDMIYLPIYYNMNIPYSVKDYLDVVMVDECISSKYYVVTNKGKIRLSTLKNKIDKGEQILAKTFNENTETFEFKPIVSVVNKGKKQVYEICTTGLNKVIATENHPFLTQNGWKRLDELVVGEDYVYLDNPTNQKCKYIPNDDQLQLILGSALGDGNLKQQSYKYEYRLSLCQGEKQYNYFMFKYNLLQNTCFRLNKGGYKPENKVYSSSSHTFLLKVKNKLDIINKLDERGLAILYMDDGSTTRKTPFYNVRISCNSFNLKETKTLINKIKTFGINCFNSPAKVNGKTYNELHFNTEEAKKFLKLIAPYMHPDCYYKNPYSTGSYKWNNSWKKYGANIVKSIKKLNIEEVMDMEVQDNHNFLVCPTNINKNGSSVLVHNCQDLSILQQKFVKKLSTDTNRFIFVGDKYQAIYGFAGADTSSIENIKRNFTLQQLPLNICYRCPENVIRVSRSIVPTIEWNNKRDDKGDVKFINSIDLKDMLQTENDVLIGRKNKDLIKIFKQFIIKEKKRVRFRNYELVQKLVNELEVTIKEYIKLYNKGLNIDKQVHNHMTEFRLLNNIESKENPLYQKEVNEYIKQTLKENNKRKKFISKSNQNLDYLKKCMEEYKEDGAFMFEPDNELTEYYDVIESFIEDYEKTSSSILVRNFIKYVKDFLSSTLDENVPIISTIHAMKGGEADNVFIYDYPLFPYKFSRQGPEEEQQEKNLQYVALTRAKKNLYLVKINAQSPEDEQLNSECEDETLKLIV